MSRETTSTPRAFPDTWCSTDEALCLVISSATVHKHGAAGAVLLAAVPRSVQRALKELIDSGVITREERFRDSGR